MDSFLIPKTKSVFEEFPVSIDFTNWLDGETISSVVYSASVVATGADATSAVLDSNKHSNTTTAARPWIKGGTANTSYDVKVQMTSSSGAKKDARIRFSVVA